MRILKLRDDLLAEPREPEEHADLADALSRRRGYAKIALEGLAGLLVGALVEQGVDHVARLDLAGADGHDVGQHAGRQLLVDRHEHGKRADGLGQEAARQGEQAGLALAEDLGRVAAEAGAAVAGGVLADVDRRQVQDLPEGLGCG